MQLLGMPEIEKVCRSLDGKVQSFVLCGGEPTTRKDLPDIARCFVDVGRVQSLAITSNGFFQERLLEAVNHTLESRRKFELRVAISLDGI